MGGSRGKTIAQNTVFLFIRMLLVLIITLFSSRVVLHTLGVEDFGIFNLVSSLVVFSAFLRSALSNATSRYITYELEVGDQISITKVYTMAINSHLLLAIIILVLMELIGVWFLNTQLKISPERLNAANWLFQFSLVSFCISIIQTPYYSNIIAHEKMGIYAVIGIFEAVLKLAICYLLIISPLDKLVFYGLLLLAVSILVFLIYVISCGLSFKDTRYIRFWDSSLLKRFASFSGWSVIVNMADICTQQGLMVMFNIFIGVVANASLGIVNQVNSGLNSLVASFTQAYNPQIIKTYASNDESSFKRLLFSTTKLTFLLFCFLSIPIFINIEYILDLWLGKGEYPITAATYTRVILIFNLVDALQTPLMQAVYATGKLKFHHIMIGLEKIMVIPLAYVVLKLTSDGAMALLVWALMNIICAISRTIYMKFLINLPIGSYLRDVTKLMLCFIVTLATCQYMTTVIDNSLVLLLVSCAFSTILLSIIGFSVVLNPDERALLKTLPVVNRFFKN